MLWAYEELGWGGYWAWDPVENAAFLPWLTASAYVHSTMIQERRGMLKVWNVFLISATFFLTIFGTFLTRSGLISSVSP
jgi:cytochrome c-type biogenesis protein CcmF